MRSATLLNENLASVNGTYGDGCVDRVGAWSLEVDVDATLDHDELSVVLNNDACVLTLTEIRTPSGAIAADPAIVLTTGYDATASAFKDPIEFHGNAKLDSASFASDFTLMLVYSADPSVGTAENTAIFEMP
jgi:hypothetical protein